jgi:hypothetical protein
LWLKLVRKYVSTIGVADGDLAKYLQGFTTKATQYGIKISTAQNLVTSQTDFVDQLNTIKQAGITAPRSSHALVD